MSKADFNWNGKTLLGIVGKLTDELPNESDLRCESPVLVVGPWCASAPVRGMKVGHVGPSPTPVCAWPCSGDTLVLAVQ